MINWIKNNKFATYILFGISFILSMISIFISIYKSIGLKEVQDVINMINTEGAPAIAIIGIIFVIMLFYVIVQLFFGALITHLIAKFIFKIPIEFKIFYRVFLIFSSFLSLIVIWELLVFKGHSDLILLMSNPFLILSLIVMFVLLKVLANINSLKPLLFTIFIFISYLVFSKISFWEVN
ncbi:hypothetical protein [Bacillus fungorum]|uniref:Yip1 domain-containing protein n=1 Tax=Bacillus fungorum TaxID=2039284 RepID=A0A2G6Q5N3_9BACI|nr:hypothetical protein [Bacillus fungorum]PIE92132.1 hypothetical protein CO726_28135 [Bacillus fungorum]